jgi:hypothetical protein
MKIALGAVMILLMIGAPSVFAISDYQSAFKLAMIDAKNAPLVNGSLYITQPGHGFMNQTKEFVNGYVTGYCKITGNAYEADFGQAIFNCMIGPSSADWRIPYHFEVLHSEYMAGYKQGFAEGVKDGHDSWFHHAKLRTYQPGFFDGYVDGWHSTCKEMGLETSPGGACDSSMDANTE